MPLATAAANDYFRFPKAEELSYFVHDLKNIQFGVKEEKRNKKIFTFKKLESELWLFISFKKLLKPIIKIVCDEFSSRLIVAAPSLSCLYAKF